MGVTEVSSEPIDEVVGQVPTIFGWLLGCTSLGDDYPSYIPPNIGADQYLFHHWFDVTRGGASPSTSRMGCCHEGFF